MTKESITQEEVTKTRKKRKKVYEHAKETDIPDYVHKFFAKEDYELRWVRFMVEGQEDYKSLSHREKEGYEMVSPDELPKEYLSAIKVMNTTTRQGLVTYGDLCLMKVDKDLRKSRSDYYNQKTDEQIKSVNILTKKKGFIDQGTRTVVMNVEPSFQGD